MTGRLSACSALFAALLLSGCVGVASSKNFTSVSNPGAAAAAPSSQFASLASLKTCTRGNPINPESLSGDCTAYASPNDPKPLVYDGTPATVYRDPVFGTKIKRLTPQPGMPVGSIGYAPKYAPYQSWSKDGTYLVLAGPGGNAYLLKGTDPYTYIRQVALPGPFDGADEPQFFWSNTNDCLLFYVNSNKIQTINICNGDAVTILATFTSLTDTLGNILDLSIGCNAGQCLIKPKIYCGFTQDDTKVSAVVTDGGGHVYGFGLFSVNLATNTAANLWFHKYVQFGSSGGDFTVNEAIGTGNAKYPGGACISDLGNYVHISWTTKDASRATNITNILANSGTVTVTGETAWPSGIRVGSTITIDNVPLASDGFNYNGQFIVATIPDSTHLTYNQAGTHFAVSGSGGSAGFVDYKWYGFEVFNARDGSFDAQISEAETHNDGMLLADGTEATAGGYVELVHDDYRRKEAYQDSTGTFFNAYEPENSYGPQWHISGRGSVSSNGLKGWALVSTYADTQQVDCSPQVIMCGEIIAVKMDNSNTFYRVAHSQSIQCDANGCQYYDEPHATPNRDFTKVIWGSDWRTFSNIMDVYLVELQ